MGNWAYRPGDMYTPPDPSLGNKCPRRLLAMCNYSCDGAPYSCPTFLASLPPHEGVATNKGSSRDLNDETTHRIFYEDNPFGRSVIGNEIAAREKARQYVS